jgi:signal peptidase I
MKNSTSLALSGKDMAVLLKAVCEKGVPFKFTAKGSSMSPFICNGDSLVIHPAVNNKNFPKNGDIVALVTPEDGHLIIHRIIRKNKDLYLTKGDNLFETDGYFRRENIHGYVTQIIPEQELAGPQAYIRNAFFFLNRLKPVAAVLSQYKLLPLICRTANRILNGNKD